MSGLHWPGDQDGTRLIRSFLLTLVEHASWDDHIHLWLLYLHGWAQQSRLHMVIHSPYCKSHSWLLHSQEHAYFKWAGRKYPDSIKWKNPIQQNLPLCHLGREGKCCDVWIKDRLISHSLLHFHSYSFSPRLVCNFHGHGIAERCGWRIWNSFCPHPRRPLLYDRLLLYWMGYICEDANAWIR